MTNLFRPESIEAKRPNYHGEVILIRPISFDVLTALAVAIASLISLFLIFGNYTKRSTVSGQVVLSSGLAKIYPRQSGIVVQRNVSEGQIVKKGDLLFVLSSEKTSSTQGDTQELLSKKMKLRLGSLEEEKEKKKFLHDEEKKIQKKNINALESELLKLENQIESQTVRVNLANESLGRYLELMNQKYISKEAAQLKHADLLDQKSRLQGLERDKINVARELVSKRDELKNMPIQHENQIGQLDREIASVGQEIIENEAKRSLVIVAPENGIATTVVAEIGQSADPNIALVSIVPENAKMQVHLYAPSKAIGFVKAGDPVLIRYQSFPYEKFGHAKGTVSSISRTAISPKEIADWESFTNPQNNGVEPLYQIIVNLSSQAIVAYGEEHPLRSGMLLNADIFQETRNLYEWVLEPLYSLTRIP